ncbi:viroplasmin family protein [Veillonella sp. AS16]|uniref:ribonuclease H1 domain-containing protein n=1 Tax=Veillonella sp. AS16 TaxID=936589 RepID=UPI0003E2A2C6|nr:ribonuclease H family protein [Veillonella sp. AS16]ETS93801.1 viroplasmin / ribonuclease HI multi-domain protein [Veillonella sp. AS16]
MAKKYYAVRHGRTPGIYMIWADCEQQVKGFGGAVYKSFPTEAEARAFIADADMNKPDFTESAHLVAYIDGSYNKQANIVGAGGIIFLNGQKETFSFSSADERHTAFWNVAGELLAAMHVMQYAVDHGIEECSLYYDYMGIEMWATKKWKRNNSLTQQYAEFYDSVKGAVNVHFHKVAAHTGDTYNEMADILAKKGAGIN